MRVSDFVKRLKKVNPKFRLVLGPGKASGLYRIAPGHEDAHGNGLVWCAAIPSPSWFFGSMPDKDFYDKDRQYHRGLRKIVNLMYEHRHLTKSKANYVYGGTAWQFP